MYCVVLLLADGSYDREFIDYLPTSGDIRELEDDYSIFVKVDNRAYYNDVERKPAKVVNLFKIGVSEDE